MFLADHLSAHLAVLCQGQIHVRATLTFLVSTSRLFVSFHDGHLPCSHSRVSKVFLALLQNALPIMKEKEQGYAVLEEVTSDTFNRFLQWVYHGFYSAPYPKAVDASSLPSPDNSAVEEANEMRIGGSVDVPASEAIEVDIGKPVELDFN